MELGSTMRDGSGVSAPVLSALGLGIVALALSGLALAVRLFRRRK